MENIIENLNKPPEKFYRLAQLLVYILNSLTLIKMLSFDEYYSEKVVLTIFTF